MPLCTGVRPFMEDMPSKEMGDIQAFTANTTAPVLSFVNADLDQDKPVSRKEMLQLIEKSGQLGTNSRQDLLDALYGRVMSKEQKAAAAALQRLSLGFKTTSDASGLKLTRVGTFNPTAPDPRGEWKSRDLLLEWAARHEGERKSAPNTAGMGQAEVASPTKLGGIVGGHKRVAVYIVENDLVPEAALQMVKQMLKATFDHTCFDVDGFTLSVGEMVGIARHEETLHVPHDTAREKAFLLQLREGCQVHTLNSQPSTLNPKPATPTPQPSTLN